MKREAVLFFFAALCAWPQASQVPYSYQNLKVQQYSAQDNAAAVKQFEGLRFTDVTDALDVVGLQDLMMMDTGIKPLWQDHEKFTHRIYGAAITLRIVPAQERAPNFSNRDDYYKWKADWAKRLVNGGYTQLLGPDTILVIDASQTRDFGICGSANAYRWLLAGLRGVVIDGGCRDSDETVLERIPMYMRGPARGINEGRMVIESWNTPVNVGGVTVMPGDIIVADADGVLAVPRAKAAAVAAEAHMIQEGDKGSRRKLYEKKGRPIDFTTAPVK